MSFFKAFKEATLGSDEENERKIVDLWKRVKNMPLDQLIDVAKLNPNSPHGKLAIILLYRKDTHAARELDRDGLHLSLLEGMRRNQYVLIGEGDEFREIRKYLIAALEVLNPSGNY